MNRMKHKPTKPETQATPRDFRQEVTDQIIALLEKGVAPWQKPWDAGRSGLMPINQVTQKPYRGGNVLHLIITALDKGYEDPRWMTYKQSADNQWQVRKGERGTQIEFWEIKHTAGKDDAPTEGSQPAPANGGEDKGERPPSKFIHRIYTVFNAQQIDGIPPMEKKEPLKPFEIVEAGESILTHSGAKIIHSGDHAFYNRARDDIHLPPREAFKDAGSYYGTALHELAHWTGHPERLNRATLNESYRFGDLNYAKEELRAELSSLFLSAERGIPHEPDRHAAYVASWVKALQDDKNEIFRAAHDASAVTDYLFTLEREKAAVTPAPAPVPKPETPPAAETHAERVGKGRTLTLDFDQGPGR